MAFTCEVGSRVIHGIVKRNAETKKAFDKAVSRGEIAGTLEQGPSTDVFVTTIGNIRAGEKLQVRIKYIGELKHDLILEGIRFTLPMIISPRFGTGGPQGNMESSLAGGISITVDVSMPSECPIQEVRSPSHPIGLFLGRVSTQGNDYPDLTKASATLSLVRNFLSVSDCRVLAWQNYSREDILIPKHHRARRPSTRILF